MRQRGRKSGQGQLTGIDGIRGTKTAPPPDNLDAFEASLWTDIMGSMPAGWFGKEAEPLLRSYCKHSKIIHNIDAELDKVTSDDLEYDVNLTRYAKLAHIRDKQTRVVLALARSMRITQQSTKDRHAGARQKSKAREEAAQPWEDKPAPL